MPSRKMIGGAFIAVAMIVSCRTPQAVSNSPAKGGPLERLARCELGNDFQIAQVDRLPHAMTRSVDTAAGPKRVDLLDGYRVLITYLQTEPFVNLKVEQLDRQTYARDKQALLDSLAYLAATGAGLESKLPLRA